MYEYQRNKAGEVTGHVLGFMFWFLVVFAALFWMFGGFEAVEAQLDRVNITG